MKRDEFDRNIMQLLNLLKKLLKNHPKGANFANFFDAPPSSPEKINLNLCFFNFMPISAEEMEELEEAYSELLDQEGEHASESEFLDLDWNQNDIDFLKRHGMSF